MFMLFKHLFMQFRIFIPVVPVNFDLFITFLYIWRKINGKMWITLICLQAVFWYVFLNFGHVANDMKFSDLYFLKIAAQFPRDCIYLKQNLSID